jgi:hypothetical protein
VPFGGEGGSTNMFIRYSGNRHWALFIEPRDLPHRTDRAYSSRKLQGELLHHGIFYRL